jgi:anti-sigma B factor antagonist
VFKGSEDFAVPPSTARLSLEEKARQEVVVLPVTERPWTSVSEDGSLTITAVPDGDVCVLRLAGELVLNTAPTLEAEVYGLFHAGVTTVILDLEDLDFIDSMGEQCLLSASRWSRRSGGDLRIVRARGQVEQVLTLTGVKPLLPFMD